MMRENFGEMTPRVGSVKTRRFESRAVCRDCDGTGRCETIDYLSNSNVRKYHTCPTCQGQRVVVVESIVNIFPITILK